MERRDFIKQSATAVAFIGTGGMSLLVETACNSDKALQMVQRFEPVVLNALNLACAVSAGNPVCTNSDRIKADYDNVVKLWADWLAAVKAGTSNVALWNDLNAAFTVFETDTATIFSFASGLNQPEITAIVASAQLLLGAIEALFPAPPPGAPVRAEQRKFATFARSRDTYTYRWLKDWAADYNGKVKSAKHKYPNVDLKEVHPQGK